MSGAACHCVVKKDLRLPTLLRLSITSVQLTSAVLACTSVIISAFCCSHECVSAYVCVCDCVCLQRSRSAFSLTSDDSPEKPPEDEGAGAGVGLQQYASLKREAKATSLPTWKSVDRLDNSSNYVWQAFYSS